ncbi:hypothetical protein KNU21_gp59 [Gordonia phage Nordenberg]|uniref:Uncharacterized protein n=1 Tax=Gordonia phage Nordenberg TaxID=2483672 RepID=A0A3G3M9E7_9CAUD|nr:hypothetical protein KNU21_gp59 [Gordonia phage Nordenberg]AYR03122.1 hypothetical protein SEA_NORDENBERG_59 [Gordonia phage Nordenberg]
MEGEVTAQEWNEHIVAEIDVLAHDAKLGTRHEQHDGWYFEVDQSTQSVHEGTAPRRVLTCGCGIVLAEGNVDRAHTNRYRTMFYPTDNQPDGMPAIPQVGGEYPHRSAAETALDVARAQQTRRGTWRIEPA